MPENTWLLGRARNDYSQSGEDGVIEAALERLPGLHRCVVEFGAHDGITNSNSRSLILGQDFDAVLIEADMARYATLAQTYAGMPGVITFNAEVGIDAETGLDSILAKVDAPIPDLVVIDIDGLDFQAWKAMTTTRPALVMVEYNQTMCDCLDWVQPPSPDAFRTGSSLSALVRLGWMKGYQLISVLPWNALFCRAEFFPLYEIGDNRPEVLRTYRGMVAHRFFSYEGTQLGAGLMESPWYQEM